MCSGGIGLSCRSDATAQLIGQHGGVSAFSRAGKPFITPISASHCPEPTRGISRKSAIVQEQTDAVQSTPSLQSPGVVTAGQARANERRVKIFRIRSVRAG